MLKTYEIVLDVEKEIYSPTNLLFSVSRNDYETVELTFKIEQDANPFDLTNKTVELAVKKPSGLTVYMAAEISDVLDGEAKAILSIQAYVEFGVHMAEVYIRDANGLIVTSPFWYNSRSSIMENDLESVNEWSALQQALFAYDLRPIIIDGFPTLDPEYVGQMAFDALNKVVYIATDLTNVSWQPLGAGEGGGGGNDTILGNEAPAMIPARIGQLFVNIAGKAAYVATGAASTDWEQIDNTAAEAAVVSWFDLADKPLTFPSEDHTHEMTEVVGLDTALAGKSDINHNHDLDYAAINHNHNASYAQVIHNHDLDYADINHNHDLDYADINHGHTTAQVTGLDTALSGKAAINHNHDLDYADINHGHTTAQITGLDTTLAGKSDTTHNHDLDYAGIDHGHTTAQITGLDTTLSGKANTADVYAKTETYNKTEVDEIVTGITEGGGTVVTDNLTSVSTTAALSANQGRVLKNEVDTKAATDHNHDAAYAPIVHNHDLDYADINHGHTTAQVTGLDTALSGKAAVDHGHTTAQITGLDTALAGKAAVNHNHDLDYAGIDHGHTTAQITGLDTALAGKADTTHNHDLDYSDINHNHDAAYSPIGHNHDLDYAASGHGHTTAQITGLDTTLAGKANTADVYAKADVYNKTETYTKTEVDAIASGITEGGGTVVQDNLTSISTTAALSANQGRILKGEVDGKAAADHNHDAAYSPIGHNHDLDYAASGHGHTTAQITGLDTALAGKSDTTHNHDLDYSDINHGHTTAQITGLDTALAGKSDTTHNHDLDYSDINHSHTTAQITGLDTALAGKADTTHNHDLDYSDINHNHDAAYAPIGHNHDLDYADINHNHDAAYSPIGHNHDLDYAASDHGHTTAQITGLDTTLAGKAPSDHGHTTAQITGLDTTLAGKSDTTHNHDLDYADINHNHDAAYAPTIHTHNFLDLANQPDAYTPTAHQHPIGDVTGLQTALDGKANTGDIPEITGLQPKPDLVGAAPATTPAFVGQMAVNTVDKRTYIAEGAAVEDWRRLAGTNYVDTADNLILTNTLGGLKLKQMTQAAYDALGTKDATTVYFIVG